MSDDPLRKWMNENKVWQMDLYRLLQKEDVSTIKDLRSLDKETFAEIQKKAKQTGFMGGKRLQALYKNEKFTEKKKKAKPKPKKVEKNTEPELDETEIKNIARNNLEPWMKDNKIWQKDLFELFVDWEIMKKEDFLSLEQDDFDEFFKEAKQKGLMGDKPKRLKALYTGKEYKKGGTSSKKKNVSKPKPKKVENEEPTQEEIEQKAYDTLKPWMTKNKIWQRDLLNVFIEYEIYTPQEFKEMDKDTFDDFFTAAKQAGLMGQKPKLLKALYTGKSVSKKKKAEPKKKESKPKEEEEDPEEIERKAKEKLEKWMKKGGFWQRDLLDLLIEYGVMDPSEFKELDKEDYKELLKSAKSHGLMGKKVDAFKAAYK